jgi:hypothetical protein
VIMKMTPSGPGGADRFHDPSGFWSLGPPKP